MVNKYFNDTIVNAEQFDGSDKMADKYNITPPMPLDPDYTINTFEGDTVLGVDDWIATGVNGEHWPIADDVFKKTYAELPVIPKKVARLIKQDKEWNYNLGMVFDDAFHGWIWENGIGKWIITHSETFARAWLDGYTVE